MKKIKPIAVWMVALVVIAIALLSADADFLWKVQQHALFLNTALFFKQSMAVSGGLLTYLGAFFTQFFYYPWMGVLLLCAWWGLLMWLTKRTFRIPDHWNILALVPVAILLVADMSLGYWVYVMKMQGYFFAPTIGTTAAVALLWLFRLLPQNLWIRSAYVVLVVAAGYPLMGVYALVTALLMGAWSWRLSTNRTQNAVISVVTLLAIAAIPLIYYRFVYCLTYLGDIYYTGIPDFTLQTVYATYRIPYYLLAVCFLTFVIFSKNCTTGSVPVCKKPVLHLIKQGVLLAVLVGGVWHFWYRDANFHHELRMERCLEKADWEGILKEGQKQDGEPTRSIVMMNNLALSRLGRQCEEMYNFPKGSRRSATPLPVYMNNTAGRQILYQYGVLNECHRLCMEQGVEFGWSAELLQYMARTSLLGGEREAAKKFLSLLHKTLFFGSWADHMEQLLNESGAIYADSETGPITRMMHYADIQSQADGYIEKNLMTMLASHDADDPYFQEQAVLAAMWTRDPYYFWPRFQHYVQQHPNDPIPRIFQEAAYLFATLGHESFAEELPVVPSIKDSFRGFMSDMQQYRTMYPTQVKGALYPKYGNTYFFEFFFLRDITYF